MKDTPGGFSFKQPPRPELDEGELEDIDAIEVSGEPVSRSEASNMGLPSLGTPALKMTKSPVAPVFSDEKKAAPPPPLEPGTPPASAAKDAGPLSKSDKISARKSAKPEKAEGSKLDQAYEHLKRNEIEEALTLAQEAVWENPSLVAAKLIIARCFINLKEYEKALAILQAIPERDSDAEVSYYIGLSLSRLGKIKEAIDALKRSRSITEDQLLKKRASDLLLHLQGEQTVCPVCGKKTLYDSMVDVGNKTVCVNCAKTIGDEDDEDDEDDVVLRGAKRRKRLKPPLTWTDILVRCLFALFLLVLAVFGFYALSIVSPSTYATLREYLPDGIKDYFPAVTVDTRDAPPPIIDPQTTASTPPKQVPVLEFDSPPLANAISGVGVRQRAYVEGLEGDYGVIVRPTPDGPYQMDAPTGLFSWTPSAKDAGKTFEVVFNAIFKNVRALDQANSVYVSKGPQFSRSAPFNDLRPGTIMHILSEDLTGEGTHEVITVDGEYWHGNLVAYSKKEGGALQELSRASIPGRPAGAGIIMAGEEKWIAVADFWTSRLRYYALRDNNLSEMSIDIDLPGRPILAGFDRDSSTSAILCRADSGNKVACFRQDNQLSSSKLGEWNMPSELVWRRIIFLPGDRGKGIEPLPVLFSGSAENAVMILEKGRTEPTSVRVPFKGVLVDAVLAPDGKFYCLIENNKVLTIVSFTVLRDGRIADLAEYPAGQGAMKARLRTVNIAPNDPGFNLVILSATKLGVAYVSGTGETGEAAYWDLPHPALIEPDFVPALRTEESKSRLYYLTSDSGLWSIVFDGD